MLDTKVLTDFVALKEDEHYEITDGPGKNNKTATLPDGRRVEITLDENDRIIDVAISYDTKKVNGNDPHEVLFNEFGAHYGYNADQKVDCNFDAVRDLAAKIFGG